ncbi:uncharacterized protein BXZ73DRAFT_107572 [Epithele typhae]|uniref:uncharacterized protein n=1 Tax=Epithele typhae TaxID=378194 RepID=UPI0020072788|nr:uncharacterized protein BXZ73DRAFT_107572 [Epithele typhae]KAH9912203.1 hypothetical protein BXZ73DRAFT_107572 [Epithele typhae]
MKEISAETFLRRSMPGEELPTDITDLYYPSEGLIYNVKSQRRVNVEIAKIARSVFLAEARTRCSAKPRMLLLDTSTRFLEADSLGAGGHQRTRHPDLSIYFNTERTHELLAANPPDESDACDELGDSSQTPTRAETMKEFIGATSYADIVVPIQVKTSHDHAAFRFQSHTGGVARRYSEKGCQSLEQITEYCSAILGRQHLTHLYAVYICRDKARLLFVDRERCYISEQFVYGTREDQTMHRFFWRLARMDRQQLGFDPSVALADGEDEKRLLAHAQGMKTADPQRALLLRALCRDPKTETHESVSSQWPLQRMTVGTKTYVVGRPIIQTGALYGPAPRVFHGFHVEQDGSIKGYTIKDYWRPDHEEIELEHKVYDRLKEKNVPYIPSCVYGGDVEVDGEAQRTENGSLVHYRIVLENMLEPLLEFKDFLELSEFMLNAMTAHEEAWSNAPTLHRQISTTSIVILSEFEDGKTKRTALLSDWELSRTKTQMDTATGPRQHGAVSDNMKEIDIKRFFEKYVPEMEPPPEVLDGFYYSNKLGSTTDDTKPEWHINSEIAKMAKSVFEIEGKICRYSENPTMVLLDTSKSSLVDDSGAGVHQHTCPDLSIYFNSERTGDMLRAKPHKKPTKTTRAEKFAGITSYADIVVPLEVKTSQDKAAFWFEGRKARSSEEVARSDSDNGRQPLAQITEYCSAILGRQHRTHLFAVYVFRNQARLLFVDREGCHISEAFVYGTRDEWTLHRFFWQLASMDRQQLGFDPSVTLANPGDKKQLLAHARGMNMADPQRDLLLHALCRDRENTDKSVSTQWPLQRMTVGTDTYLVGRPIIRTSSLYGPAPRVFHAFRIEKDSSIKGYYTIKDYWRPDINEIELEHKVYGRLKEKNVPYIPNCVYGGDVAVDGEVQRTTNEHHVACVHYRIVLEKMFQSLLDFKNFYELPGFMLTAMAAHEQAWCSEVETLHRQISTNSIVILSEFDDATQQITRTAFLSDWELSKTKTQIKNAKAPRQRGVVGPWYFRSSLSLKYPLSRPYRLSDEVEAFVHVFEYLVLRFHMTQYTQKEGFYEVLKTAADGTYAACAPGSDGLYTGGIEKFKNMKLPESWLKPRGNKTLSDILNEIATELYGSNPAKEASGDVSSDQPSVAPADGVAEATIGLRRDPLEDGPLSSHQELMAIFKDYADIKRWGGENAKPTEYRDFFRAANIAVPGFDQNGGVIDPEDDVRETVWPLAL